MSEHSSEVPQLDSPEAFSKFKLGKRVAQVYATGMLMKLGYRIYSDEIRRILTGEKSDHSEIPAELSADLDKIAQRYMQLKVKTHGNFPKLGKDERGIVFGNHPSDVTLWPLANVIAQSFTSKLKAVAKKEVMYELKTMPPFFGWIGKLSELLIVIDRDDPEAAVADIRQACETILVPGTGVVIFPDGHRPTIENLELSHAKMAEKGYSNPSELMPHTCFPKPKGLFEILSAMEGHPVRILNTTVGLSADENGPNAFGATINIYGKEVDREEIVGTSSDPEEQKKHTGLYLRRDYIEEKNPMISSWREV